MFDSLLSNLTVSSDHKEYYVKSLPWTSYGTIERYG